MDSLSLAHTPHHRLVLVLVATNFGKCANSYFRLQTIRDCVTQRKIIIFNLLQSHLVCVRVFKIKIVPCMIAHAHFLSISHQPANENKIYERQRAHKHHPSRAGYPAIQPAGVENNTQERACVRVPRDAQKFCCEANVKIETKSGNREGHDKLE